MPGRRPDDLYLNDVAETWARDRGISYVPVISDAAVSHRWRLCANAYSRAFSNTDGISTFPANPYNFSGEYGPAATDVRHTVNINGTLNTKWDIRLSPFLNIQSGVPFDITTGPSPCSTATATPSRELSAFWSM